jgi:hypothetical protein
MNTEEKPLCGYGPAAKFLTGEGYRTSKSTLSKICSPAVNSGPQIEGYWGKFPIFLPSRLIAWARARVRPGRAASGRAAVNPSHLPLTPGLAHHHTGPANGTVNVVKPTPAAASVVSEPRRRSGPRQRTTAASTGSPSTAGERAP